MSPGAAKRNVRFYQMALSGNVSVWLDRPEEETGFIGSTAIKRFDPENAVWAVYSLSFDKGVSWRENMPNEFVKVANCLF